MPKFRKKPVVIEAIRYIGRNFEELYEWGEQGKIVCGNLPDKGGDDYSILYIETLDGDLKANIGDWIIKGVHGEFYPCKPDIFEKTYEPVND